MEGDVIFMHRKSYGAFARILNSSKSPTLFGNPVDISLAITYLFEKL